MAQILSLSSLVLINIIRFYRNIISPLLGQNCRFRPSCSLYGIRVLYKFGIMKGSLLTLRRILKCHPLHHGGDDQVP